jgi:ATP-dependent Lon protease
VILPEQNKADWLEVPVEARNKLKVHFVAHISQVIQLALSPK